MSGTITKTTLIRHPIAIAHSFGAWVLLCGLFGHYATFLDLLRAKGQL